jgi:isopentenyl-diphosphate Delta-isomerase
MEKVILVDSQDKAIGTMEKMQAHREARLHRAFSIFLFNENNELLIHQRAKSKYHSGGLWTNTCCSHPGPNETLEVATKRRLKEEMGMTSDMKHMFHFTYRAELDQGLIEHEIDHVFFGQTNQTPKVNAAEVQDWKYISLIDLEIDLQKNPDHYTAWFKIIFDRVKKSIATYIA